MFGLRKTFGILQLFFRANSHERWQECPIVGRLAQKSVLKNT